jgi:2-polyprenyl-3-methyl-5-hydroxy-6-metoxy-1,4-benzoquinol methylase
MNNRQRYPKKLGIYSSHKFIENGIIKFKESKNSTIQVLDVGCATGELGEKFLNDSKFEFYGIEPFENDAENAIKKGYKIWNERIETVLPKIEPIFDIIVAGDVLEHLENPKYILDELIKKTVPGGILIISTPNVAHLFIRINLLFGKFDYTERGILDKTHLRFFTRKTFMNLISNQNVKVIKLKTSPPPIEIIIPFLTTNKIGLILQFINQIPSFVFPRLFGYQHLCILKKL